MKLLFSTVLALVSFDIRTVDPAKARPDPANPKEGPTVAWKADLRLTLERKAKEWVFVLRGSTTVPRDVSLRARVYAVEAVNDPVQGSRQDEEPLVWEDEETQPGLQVVEPADGRFRSDVHRFARRPWSILYRARLLYRPRDQDGEILRIYGQDEWSFSVDLRVGADSDFAQELKAHLEETTSELSTLEKLHGGFCCCFEEQRKQRDIASWADSKRAWAATIDEIDSRNRHRYSLWAVWVERQAKMRIGGLCELFRRIVRLADEQWGAAKPDFDRALEKIEQWREYFEEGTRTIGIDLRLDPDLFSPLLRDYEIGFAPLRASLDGGPAEGTRREAHRDCLAALFRMMPLIHHRKFSYHAVNQVCERLTRLLEVSDDPPFPGNRGGVQKALEDHDLAFRNLLKLTAVR